MCFEIGFVQWDIWGFGLAPYMLCCPLQALFVSFWSTSVFNGAAFWLSCWLRWDRGLRQRGLVAGGVRGGLRGWLDWWKTWRAQGIALIGSWSSWLNHHGGNFQHEDGKLDGHLKLYGRVDLLKKTLKVKSREMGKQVFAAISFAIKSPSGTIWSLSSFIITLPLVLFHICENVLFHICANF